MVLLPALLEGGEAFLEVVLPSAVPSSVGLGDGDLALDEPEPEPEPEPPLPAVEVVVIVSAAGGVWLLLFSACIKGSGLNLATLHIFCL